MSLIACEGNANQLPARVAFEGDYRLLIGRFEVDTWGYVCRYHCGASVQTTHRYTCSVFIQCNAQYCIQIITLQLCSTRNVLTFLIAALAKDQQLTYKHEKT